MGVVSHCLHIGLNLKNMQKKDLRENGQDRKVLTYKKQVVLLVLYFETYTELLVHSCL